MVEGTRFLPTLSMEEMLQMLKVERVGRIGLNDKPQPYVVPTDFAFGDGVIYIHSPRVGRKAELARKDNHVCFEVDRYNEDVTEYRSIIIRGLISEVKDAEECKKAMRLLAEKARNSGAHVRDNQSPAPGMSAISIFKIEIKDMTGIKSPNGGHP